MTVLSLLLVASLVGSTLLILWAGRPAPNGPRVVRVDWPDGAPASQGADLLVDAGITRDPLRFRALLVLSRPFFKLEPGEHLLSLGLTPMAVLRRLARLSSRDRVRVLVPEGFNQYQIAERLEKSGICFADSFLLAARDRAHLERLSVKAPDAEGYLFPATYELFVDSRPETVVDKLVREGVKRVRALVAKEAASMDRLEKKYGWGERELLTLASIVEKETSVSAEQPVVASVFFNRLDDPNFRPRGRLQSDPTAGYGCLVAPDLASCANFNGRIAPPMLRDADNPYNTYKHVGLPPGPIANPGAGAIVAVLNPARTEFLFFVASENGRHTFSRSFAEHEAALSRPAPKMH